MSVTSRLSLASDSSSTFCKVGSFCVQSFRHTKSSSQYSGPLTFISPYILKEVVQLVCIHFYLVWFHAGFRQCSMYLCILVHCKECQHTERSRNIQGVLAVPSPLQFPGDPERHGTQWHQKDLGVLSLTPLVALRRGQRHDV